MSKPMIKHCQNCKYFEIRKIVMYDCPRTIEVGKCDVKYKNIPKFLRRITALCCKYYREDENIANEYD